ncbi:Sec-independent protein translocase protein TatB [Sulfurimonas paralvinellae]|uniref:Sec-independent protein translocase protein TatB homolog n=1 Tax=Sulfurimonas paralvinellae TaxID=317658 RepID=A0A7M1B950_9BACT|nr:Sec-independent protein translocase protein TatB [Sulfurimonas paralvinellae]QOP46259.1 Sec-independent protein translocase subunit TatB [Sulfurimonas paralvinellae]
MFGMGFTEILLIAVIAILFLGPDKLPSTMIEIAKFFRSVKSTIGSVKDSLEEEMNVTGIKQEALAYKEELLKASESVHKATNVHANLGAEIDNILNDDEPTAEVAAPQAKKTPKEPQEVTFKKKKKKKSKPSEEKLEDKEENTDV